MTSYIYKQIFQGKDDPDNHCKMLYSQKRRLLNFSWTKINKDLQWIKKWKVYFWQLFVSDTNWFIQFGNLWLNTKQEKIQQPEEEKTTKKLNGLNNHVSRRDCKLSFHKRYKLSYQQNFLIEKKDEEWVFQYHHLLK